MKVVLAFSRSVASSFETARSLSSGAHSRDPLAPPQDEDTEDEAPAASEYGLNSLMVRSAAKPRVSNHRAGTHAVRAAFSLATPATANDLRYQLTFVQLARQCFLVGSTLRMKAGVQGRVVVGPAGAPYQVEVPIRFAVVREGVEPKTIITKLKKLTVALPPGTGNVEFTDIEDDLSFPLPSRAELDSYMLYIGYDGSATTERKPAPKAAKKGPPAKRAN